MGSTPDFNDFHRTARGFDSEIVGDLRSIASECYTLCDFISEELSILSSIRNDADKSFVKHIVQKRIELTNKMLDSDVELINADLSAATKPSVVAQANRMRSDVRDLQEALQKLARE